MSTYLLPIPSSTDPSGLHGDQIIMRRPLGNLSVNATPSKTNTNKSSKTTKMTSVSALKIQSNRGSFSETYDGSEQHKKSLDKEHEIPSIFRARPVLEDDEDLDNNEFMILKRATPVFDTDEESPMKRLRRTSSFDDQDERDDANEGQMMASSILSWSDALLEGDDGFSFENIMLSR